MKTIPVNNGTIEIVKWEKEDARVTYAWRFKSNNNVVACTGNRWYRTPKECEVAALKVFKESNTCDEKCFIIAISFFLLGLTAMHYFYFSNNY